MTVDDVPSTELALFVVFADGISACAGANEETAPAKSNADATAEACNDDHDDEVESERNDWDGFGTCDCADFAANET